MSDWLPLVWGAILLLEIALYVILDGADLGIGVIALFAKSEKQRSTMLTSIGPIWDANETWLVIAGGTLFGAFPIAYGIVLNALQIPVMLIAFGLIFRAVSYEFRQHATNTRFWSMAFSAGSLLAILAQGFAVGGLASGITVSNGSFAGGPLDWLNPLSIIFGIGAVVGYTMLGYAFLIKKTRGKLERQSYHQLIITATIALLMSVATTALLPLTHGFILSKYGIAAHRNAVLTLIAVTLFAFRLLIRSAIQRREEHAPYTFSLAIFALSFVTLAYSLYPYLVPPTTTIFAAASSRSTLSFMLFGIGILIPVVLFYNAYVHRLFDDYVDRRGGYL